MKILTLFKITFFKLIFSLQPHSPLPEWAICDTDTIMCDPFLPINIAPCSDHSVMEWTACSMFPPFSSVKEIRSYSVPDIWQELPRGTQYFSWAPSCSWDVALFSCWVVSVFVYMWVFHEKERLILCFLFDSGILPRLVAYFIVTFFSVYIVKFSKPVRQGVLGKSKFIIVIMKLWN